MTAATIPFALNPIQWRATDDGWLDFERELDPRELLLQIKAAGFDGVFAEVPAGWTIESYRDVLEEVGLRPAPGYLVVGSGDGVGEAEILERAAAAARVHAELGLDDILVGAGMSKDATRVQHPARGYAADPARLDRMIDLLGRVGEVTRAEGVRAAVHPHVGTVVETDAEARAVLDAVDAATLGFGPDTGHLAWAGADVAQLIRDYGSRVTGMHVKDCRLSVARRARELDLTYQQTVMEGLWAEPGRGELELEGIIASLPDEFAGWLIVEVDRPDIPDPFESARASASWMRGRNGSSRERPTDPAGAHA